MVIYIAIAVIVVVAAIFFYRKKRKKDMAAGLEIYDASGKLIFDLANRTGYVYGTAHTGTANGSISDSRVLAGRTWVVITSANSNAVIPYFTVSNGSIAWTFYNSTTLVSVQDVTFMYGVY